MHKKRKGGEKSVGFVSTVGKEKEIQVGTNSFVCLGCRSLAKKAQLILRSGDAEAAWVAAGRSTVSLSSEDFKMIRDVRQREGQEGDPPRLRQQEAQGEGNRG